VGAVDVFETLANAEKNHGVLTDDITGADGGKRYLFFVPFADEPSVDTDLFEIATEGSGDRTGAKPGAVPIRASFLKR
jgi:hypothetical protein